MLLFSIDSHIAEDRELKQSRADGNSEMLRVQLHGVRVMLLLVLVCI